MKEYKTMKLSELNSLGLTKDTRIKIDKLIIDTEDTNIPINFKKIEVNQLMLKNRIYKSTIKKNNVEDDDEEATIYYNIINNIFRKVPFNCIIKINKFSVFITKSMTLFISSDKKIYK